MDAFILPTDSEEFDDLARATGITFLSDDSGALDAAVAVHADAANFDALASFLLRRLAGHREESDRLVAAMKKEQELIIGHYNRLIEATHAKEADTTKRLELLTTAAIDAGALTKKQTRETAFGEYGWRKVPETVKVTDPDALLMWASANRPELVKRTEKITETVPAAAIKPVALAIVQSGDECPPGCEYVGQSVTFIAKPRERVQ